MWSLKQSCGSVMESSAESTTESTAEPESGRGPRPTCPYGLVCPLTSRPQHRVCEVKKQTRDGTGKRKKKKKRQRRKNNKERRMKEGRGRKEKRRWTRRGQAGGKLEVEGSESGGERRVGRKRCGRCQSSDAGRVTRRYAPPADRLRGDRAGPSASPERAATCSAAYHRAPRPPS